MHIGPQQLDLVDEAITAAHAHLATLKPDTPEYAATCDQLKKLYEIKTTKSRDPVSYDSMFKAGSQLAIAALIVSWELNGHVVVTKALEVLSKLR